jgi:hypothetical protein
MLSVGGNNIGGSKITSFQNKECAKVRFITANIIIANIFAPYPQNIFVPYPQIF